MAVTKIWRVRGSAGRIIDYASNPEKTALGIDDEELSGLADVLDYADDEIKTEKHFYTTGINCDREFAKEEFQLTKERFGKQGGIVAIHGYQSFEEEEVLPSTAHEIGVKLARELWGDRFQVIVATHLNTDHVHNHFVINSVSFKDGLRFHMCTARYQEMRETSDRLCREYELSVIEHPQGKGKAYAISKLEKAGMPTRYSVARAAIDTAISRSLNMDEFKYELKQLGFRYQFNPNRKYWTVTIPGGEKPIRIHQLGSMYSKESVMDRVYGNDISVRQKKYMDDYEHQPNRYNFRRRIHKINDKTGLEKLYLRVCYEMGYLPKYQQDPARIHRLFLEDIFKCERYAEEAKFLIAHDIETENDLDLFINDTEEKMTKISDARNQFRADAKRNIPEPERDNIRQQITELTKELRELRHERSLLEDIKEKSKTFEERIKTIDKERNKEVRYR